MQHRLVAILCVALLSFANGVQAASTIDALPATTFPFPDSGLPATSTDNAWISQAGADKRATYQQLSAPYQGPVAPAAPFKYQLWWNTGTVVPQLEAYDGSQWQVVGALDATNHAWVPPVGGGAASLNTQATVDLGAVPEAAITLTGAGTISGFGSSAPLGTVKFLTFAAAVTLTNNATALILPGQRDILTASGDQIVAQSLGSGNWRVLVYEPLAPGGAVCTTAASAPANPTSGQCWLDTAAAPAPYELYDGSQWVVTGYLDTGHHTWLPVEPSDAVFPENYGALGNGSSDDAPALAAACTAAASANVPLVLRQKYALASNRTLACNLAFMPAAYLAPAVATTTTITGWVHAGDMERIFQGAGAVTVTGSPTLSAQWWGVVNALGFTTSSADVALGRALTACTAIGGHLMLPSGTIALTGAQTNTLSNCHVSGSGVIGGTAGVAASDGTLVTLTSTTTAPFIIQSNWALDGVNFYWPNQTTGTTAYPCLMADDGVHQANFWWLDHVNIVNAYDGVCQTPGLSWGAFHMTDGDQYAVHDLYKFSFLGDSSHWSNVHFTDAAWAAFCPSCTTALHEAPLHNAIFHIIDKAGTAGVTLFAKGGATFGWRFGVYLDAAGQFVNSEIDLGWDGVATLIDSSSGGNYSGQNKFIGSSANCFTPFNTTNLPCFNLGVNGALVLDGWHNYGASGSFVQTAGASVYLRDVVVDNIGAVADGGNYYMVQPSAVTAGTEIVIEGSRFTGINGSTKTHGLSTAALVAARIAVQNSHWEFLNDDISITAALTTIITGNWSAVTHGSESVAIIGTNPVQYSLNFWDKPPTAGVSNCGAGAAVVGALSGVIQVGSTNPTTACTLTLPWATYGDGAVNGACAFTPTVGPIVTTAILGLPAAWTLSSGAVDIHGTQIYFNCPGQQ